MVGGEGFGNALGCLYYGFILCLIGCLISGIIFVKQIFWPKQVVIKTEQRIEPEIQLIIKNNQVDTIYLYRKP